MKDFEMKRSPSYVFTFDKNDNVGKKKLAYLRAEIAYLNACYKSKGNKFRERVIVRGRLGKNNPYAYLYNSRYKAYTVKLEHATRFDVYVCVR